MRDTLTKFMRDGWGPSLPYPLSPTEMQGPQIWK